jgi:hypothetical protein
MIPKTKGSKVVRHGEFQRELQATNAIHSQQVAQMLGDYHMRFIEPRLRVIEWMLVLPALYRLVQTWYRRIKRWYAGRKKSAQPA